MQTRHMFYVSEQCFKIHLSTISVEIIPIVDEYHIKPDVEDVPEVQDELIDEELQTPPPHHFPPFHKGHRRGND